MKLVHKKGYIAFGEYDTCDIIDFNNEWVAKGVPSKFLKSIGFEEEKEKDDSEEFIKSFLMRNKGNKSYESDLREFLSQFTIKRND